MRQERQEVDEYLDRIGRQIVDAALSVHKGLGPGLLESAYETCLGYELEKRGRRVARQVGLPVIYDGIKIDVGYRLDLLVEDDVVVEIKSIAELSPVHDAQLLTYLRMSGCQLGYLINFNVPLIKQGIRRFALTERLAQRQAL